jgi:hypothetical protein
VHAEAAITAGLVANRRKEGPVKFFIAKRLAPAALALGVAVGGLGVTATTAFASTQHANAAKAGAACTKKELNKTAKAGKEVLVCKKTDGKYKWEKK